MKTNCGGTYDAWSSFSLSRAGVVALPRPRVILEETWIFYLQVVSPQVRGQYTYILDLVHFSSVERLCCNIGL